MPDYQVMKKFCERSVDIKKCGGLYSCLAGKLGSLLRAGNPRSFKDCHQGFVHLHVTMVWQCCGHAVSGYVWSLKHEVNRMGDIVARVASECSTAAFR